MSCLGVNYNPKITRTWSRNQGVCSSLTQNVGSVNNYNDAQVQHKYEVLQYKNNSSNLTKKQVYSLMSKGQWTARNKSWATQSQTYTNPNTNNLKRVNTETVIVNSTETLVGGTLICN
jgi:predicted RND superfamily exporter protein